VLRAARGAKNRIFWEMGKCKIKENLRYIFFQNQEELEVFLFQNLRNSEIFSLKI
jgi:hypothetical protein